MESEPKGRDEQASEEREDEHPHVTSAAELSDRAAESVGRRYDATNEGVEEADAHDGTD
jgi:hypothetical protein